MKRSSNSGLRNPFRSAVDPNADGTRYFVHDVGQHNWEEVHESAGAADYGWPLREGPCDKDLTTGCTPTPAGMTDPVHAYQHVPPSGGAATDGAFVPRGVWPAQYDGSYLFDASASQDPHGDALTCAWDVTDDGPSTRPRSPSATPTRGRGALRPGRPSVTRRVPRTP